VCDILANIALLPPNTATKRRAARAFSKTSKLLWTSDARTYYLSATRYVIAYLRESMELLTVGLI
jgi:hypothetical protein